MKIISKSIYALQGGGYNVTLRIEQGEGLDLSHEQDVTVYPPEGAAKNQIITLAYLQIKQKVVDHFKSVNDQFLETDPWDLTTEEFENFTFSIIEPPQPIPEEPQEPSKPIITEEQKIWDVLQYLLGAEPRPKEGV